MSRHFVRCALCLAVSAIDEAPASVMQCGLCAGHLEHMGRVERDRLVRDEWLSPCDDRCTCARGPICSCKCGGKYHGSNLVVHVTHDAGKVPTITPRHGREQARINAEEFTRARAALLAQLDPLLARRHAGIYLDTADYRRMRQLQAANGKAHQLRDHRARMKTFRAVLPVSAFHTAAPRAEAASPIAQLAAEIPTVNAPIADVPFSLTGTAARRSETQTRLF